MIQLFVVQTAILFAVSWGVTLAGALLVVLSMCWNQRWNGHNWSADYYTGTGAFLSTLRDETPPTIEWKQIPIVVTVVALLVTVVWWPLTVAVETLTVMAT